MAATTAMSASPLCFQGLKATTNLSSKKQVSALPSLAVRGKGALGARCNFIGYPTNLIIVGSTTTMLFVGRFGLTPSANRKATAGLRLEDKDSGLQTGDPVGFTGTNTLACGVMGRIIGVGIVLGLKALGNI